jgi:hypothetical protein
MMLAKQPRSVARTTAVLAAAWLFSSLASATPRMPAFANSYPHIIEAATSPRAHVDDILRFANAGLSSCTIVPVAVDDTEPGTHDYRFTLRAHYADGSYTANPVPFRANLDDAPPQIAERLLKDFIPWVHFIDCVPKSDGGAAIAQRHIERSLTALNERLQGCSIKQQGRITMADASGEYTASLYARYDDGTETGRRNMGTNYNNSLDTELAYFLGLIPAEAFPRCAHRDDRPDPDTVRAHLTDVIAAANSALDGCTLVQQGDIGAVDATGAADYLLIARNDDGSSDQQQRFRTSIATSVDTERDALLAMIPSQRFPKCRHAGEGPDPAEMLAHVQAIVTAVNAGLEQCTIELDGALGTPGADGWFDFYLIARYPDATRDARKAFRTSLGTDAADQAAGILELIPSQMFRRCHVRDDGVPTDPVEAAALQHVIDVLNATSERLNGCNLERLGPIGPIDSHGGFDYYVQAYVRATGQATPGRRFTTNRFNTVENDVATLLNLIPAVEFSQCPHRD